MLTWEHKIMCSSEHRYFLLFEHELHKIFPKCLSKYVTQTEHFVVMNNSRLSMAENKNESFWCMSHVNQESSGSSPHTYSHHSSLAMGTAIKENVPKHTLALTAPTKGYMIIPNFWRLRRVILLLSGRRERERILWMSLINTEQSCQTPLHIPTFQK